jgi:hypothetical protein
MDGMNPSLTKTCLICFQSATSASFNSKHTDSSANLTAGGGFAIERTSAKCFFLIPLTAKLNNNNKKVIRIFIGVGRGCVVNIKN